MIACLMEKRAGDYTGMAHIVMEYSNGSEEKSKIVTAPITADFFLKLGWAVGSVLAKKYPNPSVIIGKDTRISGYLFEDQQAEQWRRENETAFPAGNDCRG